MVVFVFDLPFMSSIFEAAAAEKLSEKRSRRYFALIDGLKIS